MDKAMLEEILDNLLITQANVDLICERNVKDIEDRLQESVLSESTKDYFRNKIEAEHQRVKYEIQLRIDKVQAMLASC